MDLPPEKHACVHLAHKSENGRSNMFQELMILDSHKTDETCAKV